MTITFTHETLPADPKAAIRQMKQALRAQIGDVQAVFDRLSATIEARVAQINALKAQGQPVWQAAVSQRLRVVLPATSVPVPESDTQAFMDA